MNYVEYIVKVYENGDKYWYKNGNLHREDGPAIEHANGNKCWYKNGYLHRENGPAKIYLNGDKEWYLNGKRHREDGPAVEYNYGYKNWYLDGVLYSEEEYNKEIAKRKNNCQNKTIFIDGKEYVLVPKEDK